MAQAKGSSTKLSYVEEDSFGVTPPSPEMRLIPLTREELGVKSNGFIQVKDGAERVSTGAGSGYVDAGGSVALGIELDSIGTLLKHSLGNAVTSGSSAPFTHVISGGSTLPAGLSIEKGFNDVARFMLFKGCRIDSLTLQFPGDGGLVSGTLDILSKTVETATASVASSLLEGEPISYQVSIEDGGAALDSVLSAQLVLQNGLDRDGFVLGSRDRYSIGEGLRRVSGSLTLEFEDFSHYTRFYDGGTSSLKITLDDVTGGLSMEVLLPRVVFTRSAPAPLVKDAGPLVSVLNFLALKDPSEGTDIKITLINNQSSV